MGDGNGDGVVHNIEGNGEGGKGGKDNSNGNKGSRQQRAQGQQGYGNGNKNDR